MHRDVVTHVVMTPCGTDFLVTASADGHIKFWKKMPEGVEFVKHYHAHLEPIHDLAVSWQLLPASHHREPCGHTPRSVAVSLSMSTS